MCCIFCFIPKIVIRVLMIIFAVIMVAAAGLTIWFAIGASSNIIADIIPEVGSAILGVGILLAVIVFGLALCACLMTICLPPFKIAIPPFTCCSTIMTILFLVFGIVLIVIMELAKKGVDEACGTGDSQFKSLGEAFNTTYKEVDPIFCSLIANCLVVKNVATFPLIRASDGTTRIITANNATGYKNL